MQCREISDLTMKYFDGNISEIELQQIMKHNETCPDCREEFEALKDALFTVEDLPELAVPDDFELKVMEKLKAQTVHSYNPKILLFGIMGVVGLGVFALNMLIFVIIPYIRYSGLLLAAYNTIVYGIYQALDMVRESIVTFTVYASKLLVFRDIILKDYMTVVALCVLVLVCGNLLLYRTLRLQRD